MILSDIAIKNRVTVAVLIVLILAMGTWSYITLPREAAPDVQIPIIIVTTVYEGVSPADVESAVTNKIEKKLSGLKGVKEIRSSSADGMSMIIIEFLPEVKVDAAMQYVRDKVDLAKPDLPKEVDAPSLREINVAEIPVIMISISGDVSPVLLKEIADDLEDAIEERLPEVLNVDVIGGLEREIRLEIDAGRVAGYGLTIPELMALIPSENVNISAGNMETGGMKFNVRVPAEVKKPSEIDRFVLAQREGKPIYLTDVAKVTDTFKDRTSYARLDGRESITLSVQKRVGANILVLSDKMRAILDEARKIVPKGVNLEVTIDQSDEIRMMVADLENNIATGFILVVGVLLIFMSFRSSMVVATIIPLSMLMSFAIIQAMGYTLNMIVLFSLVMATGMLVDNAIVIVENIYRHMTIGYRPLEAAQKGTAEVAWPVITSTLTTVAAFAPLVFWPGMMGDFMKYLPITLIIVLMCSLFVAMVINPTISALSIKVKVLADHVERRRRNPFMAGYRAVLQTSLDRWYVTLCVSLLLLFGLAIAYGKWGRGVELFPDLDPKNGLVNLRAPQGTNIEDINRLALEVERRLAPYRRELKHMIANVGEGSGGGDPLSPSTSGTNIANITLVFKDFDKRQRQSATALDEIRALLADLPGVEVKVEKQKEGPPTGAAVTVRVIGKDIKQLEEVSEQARKMIADVPGLVNLRSDWVATKPELAFQVDRRRATLLGLNPTTIGNYLKTALFGWKVGTYRQFPDEYDITIRLPLTTRADVEKVLQLQVPSANGSAVPLSSLGSFEYTGGRGTLLHVNAKPVITLTGDAEGRSGQEVLADAQERLAGLQPPAGVELKYAGEQEEQEKAQSFLVKAFIIALLLITLILVMQFNTVSVPLIIMSTVVLSLIGVLGGLLAAHQRFGIIMTGIGVISLAGVVVNNAIVLLDYTRQLQQRGMGVVEASVEAGATRLRPVLLTAGTTVLGLVPMALGISFDFHTMEMAWKSESSQWWSSMAVAVIFGLTFATVLTLVVVPTLYVLLYRLAARMGLGGLRKIGEAEPKSQPVLEDY